jgi:hypothetical protein
MKELAIKNRTITVHEDAKIEICPTENGHFYKQEQSEPHLWKF